MVHTKTVESTRKIQFVKTKYGINQCPPTFDILTIDIIDISQIEKLLIK